MFIILQVNSDNNYNNDRKKNLINALYKFIDYVYIYIFIFVVVLYM